MLRFRHFFKHFAVSVTLIAGVLLAGCSEQANNATTSNSTTAFKVGMSGNYYPFTFMEKGELQGFEVDIWNEISKRTDVPVEFVTAPFSGLFGMLEAGQITSISNQITLTPERAERYAFSQPYVFDGAQITVHKNNTSIRGFDDLKGKRVAVNLGTNFEQLLRARDPDNSINIVTYESGVEQDVVVGRSDAFLMDRVSVLSLIRKTGAPLKLAGDPIGILENAMPFKKTETGIKNRDRVNQALDAMRADGTLSRLSEKWFSADITQRPSGA